MAREDPGLPARPCRRPPDRPGRRPTDGVRALRQVLTRAPASQSMGQAAKFAGTGIAGTASHSLALFLFVEVAGIQAVVANGLAFLCALGVSWLGQSRWAFRGAAPDPTRGPRFLVAAISGFLANLLLMWLAVDVMGAGWPVGLLLVLVIVPPATFLLAIFWVFEGARPR